MFSVTILLCNSSSKAATDGMQTNKYGSVSIKCYLQKQAVWPADHSLQIRGLYIHKIGRINTSGSLAISPS